LNNGERKKEKKTGGEKNREETRGRECQAVPVNLSNRLTAWSNEPAIVIRGGGLLHKKESLGKEKE